MHIKEKPKMNQNKKIMKLTKKKDKLSKRVTIRLKTDFLVVRDDRGKIFSTK